MLKLSEMSNEQLEMLVNLSESRILSISKDDLRLSESQVLYDPKLEKDVLAYWNELNKAYKSRTLPKCTCLDHEGGFMGKRSKKGKIYNDYFYDDQPCSYEWIVQHKDLMKGWRVHK